MRKQRHLAASLAGACRPRGRHAGVGAHGDVAARHHAHRARTAPQRTVGNQHTVELDGAGGRDVDDAIEVLQRRKRFQVAQVDRRAGRAALHHCLPGDAHRMGRTTAGARHQAHAVLGRDPPLNIHRTGGRALELPGQQPAHGSAGQHTATGQQAVYKGSRWRGERQPANVHLPGRPDRKTVAVNEHDVAANAAIGQAALQPAINAHPRIAHDVDPPVGALGHRQLDRIALADLEGRVGAERVAVPEALGVHHGLLALGADHRGGLHGPCERGNDGLRMHHRTGRAQRHRGRQG